MRSLGATAPPRPSAEAGIKLGNTIALAAIALLTRKKWLEYAMFGAGAVGIVVGVLAALHI